MDDKGAVIGNGIILTKYNPYPTNHSDTYILNNKDYMVIYEERDPESIDAAFNC